MPAIKTEERAVNAVKRLIDESKYMTTDEIKEGDKGVSFDGFIPIYSKEDLTKKDFKNKIDIQIKGRTKDKISSKKSLKFALERSDIENYKRVGGALIFYVQVEASSLNTIIYLKSLLPYEANQLLRNEKGDRISLKFDLVESIIEFENACNQFLIDKDKQYSFKDDFKTVADFKDKNGKFKFDIPLAVIKKTNDFFDKGSFVYFEPDDLCGVNIPCGIAKIHNITNQKQSNIVIGDKNYIADVVTIRERDNFIVKINNCIILDDKKKLISFNMNGRLSDVLKNIEMVDEFIKHKKIEINGSSIKCNDTNDYHILENQKVVINCLDKTLKILGISYDPLIDFSNIDTIKHLLFISENLINGKGIPYIKQEDVFAFKIEIFDCAISLKASKREDGLYDVSNLKDIIFNQESLFRSTAEDGTTTDLYPNICVFQEDFKLDASYLCAYNILPYLKDLVIDYNKIVSDEILFNHFIWFILDLLSYYDSNNKQELLMFIKRITKELYNTKNSDINTINYYQTLKRCNELTDELIADLIELRDETDDLIVKYCVSVIIDDKTSFKIYYNKMSDKEKQEVDLYPINNIKK